MKYTQQQLESMSDLELNMTTSRLLSLLNVTVNNKRLFGAVKREGVTNITTHIDYCNKWSDCGALIDECNINTTKGSQMCSAVSWIGSELIQVIDANVKRAVTIVYILVKQSNG